MVSSVWWQPDDESKDKCVLSTVKHGGGSGVVWGFIRAASCRELQSYEGFVNAEHTLTY